MEKPIKILTDQDFEDMFYSISQRMKWFINGIGIHGLTWHLFDCMSNERLCELYNMDMNYFKRP